MSLETLDSSLVRFQHSKSSFSKFSPKFALFDLDGTLITTRSGNKFPKTVNDWKWLNSAILPKIKELIIDKYNIIIVSNQSGAEKSLSRKEQILESVGNVFKELVHFYEPEHFEIYLSLSTDVYRKPNTTIFEKYIWPRIPEKNIERIFYVGDAAGREGDFADSDRKFAYNLYLFLNTDRKVSVPFLTPEEFFLRAKPKTRTWRGFNPREYYDEMKDCKPQKIPIDNSVQTVLLLVGPPASGKSTMTEKILESIISDEFCVVCQDSLKTKSKCLSSFKEFLEDGTQLIIVDKTNPSRASRGEYIDIVRQHEEYSGHKIVIKAVEFQCSPEFAKHMNVYRERISFHRGNNVKRVPEIAYRKFWKDFQEPSESEDIDEVIEIKMVPEFKSKYEILMFLQKS